MHLTRRLSQPQRIVVVIALGVACAVAAVYLTNLGGPAATFGWYAYAPLTTANLPRTGLGNWARLLIWLGFTALWALASLGLLRPARRDPS